MTAAATAGWRVLDVDVERKATVMPHGGAVAVETGRAPTRRTWWAGREGGEPVLVRGCGEAVEASLVEVRSLDAAATADQ